MHEVGSLSLYPLMELNILQESTMTSSFANYSYECYNPSLGLATKARGCKVAGQEGEPRVTSHAPGSAKSVRE